MKKYHYSDGDNQFGPLTIEELSDKKISKDTMVWYEGLDNWVKASEVDELKVLFKSVPPPLTSTKQTPPPINKSTNQSGNANQTTSPQKKSKKGLVIGIISGVIILAVVAVLIINKNQSSNNDYNNNSSTSSESNINSAPSNNQQDNYTPPPPRQKTAEELRQELYKKEKTRPGDYLSVTYKLNYKVLSGKDEIIGTVYNSASMATFKDIVLTVTYSTNTDTELSRENYTLYEYVNPGSSKSFNIKTYSPSGTKKIGVYVQSATGE